MGKTKKMPFEKIFPILAIDEQSHLIVSANGDLTLGFELFLPDIYTISLGTYDALHEIFVNALKNLPVGYIFHKQDWYIEDAFKPDFTTNWLINSNSLAIENELHFAERPYINHRCYIFITCPSAHVLNRTSLKSSLLKRHLVPREHIEQKRVEQIIEATKKFAYLIQATKNVILNILRKEDLIADTGLFQNYSSLSYNDPTLYELETSSNGKLMIGTKVSHTHVIAELKNFPTSVHTAAVYQPYSTEKYKVPISTASPLGIGLHCNHIVNQVIVLLDKDNIDKQLVAENKRHNGFTAWSSDNQNAMISKADFLDRMYKGGHQPVKFHLNVLVWDEDEARAYEHKNNCAAAMANMGFVPAEANADAATLYWSCIPGNIAEIGADNLATCFLEEAVCLLPLETNYNDATVSQSGIRLTDRSGKPVMVDLFFEPMKRNLIANRNMFIVGPSGSGKSFLVNNMVYYMLANQMHVTIVDVGHSYRPLCDLMGGRYITYESENPIHFNPFYFKANTASEEEMESIAELLKGLWKNDNDIISNAEATTVSNIIFEYFKYLRQEPNQNIFPCFDSFYEFTLHHYEAIFKRNGGTKNEFDLVNFLYCLKPYYGGEEANKGKFHYLLNSRQNIDLDEIPFVIYELDNIKDHPVLFPVTTVMIMTTYVRKLSKIKGVLKALLIEEAWKALMKPKFASFLQWASKTVRKHYGSLGVVTQELDDLLGNTFVKDALVNNSDIKLLLDQSKYANRFEEVINFLGLTELEAAIVQSVARNLDPHRPPHREVAILMKNHAKVYGIEVSKIAYAGFTTEKKEKEEIQDLTDKYANREIALRAWANGERVYNNYNH